MDSTSDPTVTVSAADETAVHDRIEVEAAVTAKMGTVEETTAETNVSIDAPLEDNKMRICVHICEKKRRRCKFNAIKNCDYCVEHLAFNKQTDAAEKRVICPLDPKHSVYAKNFKKHLTRCNSRVQCIGEFDVKDINVRDNDSGAEAAVTEAVLDENAPCKRQKCELATTFRQLDEAQLRHVIDLLVELDSKFQLTELPVKKLHNDYLSSVLTDRGETALKHLRQISSITGHVDALLSLSSSSSSDSSSDSTAASGDQTCLVELGAGRGKLSYWFEESRGAAAAAAKQLNEQTPDASLSSVPPPPPLKRRCNILLIERGAQRFKFDGLLKKEPGREFERLRIDLKDVYLNKVPLLARSANYVLYGKHLCGVATDYALRAMKHALEDTATAAATGTTAPTQTQTHMAAHKFAGLVLAVCCHHKCEWESFCGLPFLAEQGIDARLFYILRSISSWCTCGCERNTTPPAEDSVFGHNKQKIGRICKNLFDMARVHYLRNSIRPPAGYCLDAQLFYYVDADVTLENSMIHARLVRNVAEPLATSEMTTETATTPV